MTTSTYTVTELLKTRSGTVHIMHMAHQGPENTTQQIHMIHRGRHVPNAPPARALSGCTLKACVRARPVPLSRRAQAGRHVDQRSSIAQSTCARSRSGNGRRLDAGTAAGGAHIRQHQLPKSASRPALLSGGSGGSGTAIGSATAQLSSSGSPAARARIDERVEGERRGRVSRHLAGLVARYERRRVGLLTL